MAFDTVTEVQLTHGRYNMTVDRVNNNRKSFPSRSGIKYVNDIYFVNSDGEGYRGEYLTQSPGQSEFTVGETCCFQVTDEKNHVIEKCSTTAQFAGAPKTQQAGGNSEPEEDVFSPNVAGKSYCFAMAYAKDLAVARIRGGFQTGDEDDFIHRIKAEAWEMHLWMMNPEPPQEKLPF